MTTPTFPEALASRVLVCDGAMGTMLYAKGIFLNRSFDELNLTQPDFVAEVHQAYVRAGADVIETNTFGANRVKLAPFGLGDQVKAINAQGAKIARQAAREQAFVAGVDRPARHPHRALGQDRRRRGRGVLPRAGRRAARRRRRSLRARDLPRRQRDRRGDPRGARPLRPADRRAGHHRRGRQHARRRAAGGVRAAARGARRDADRRQLQRRSGRHARDDRADGAGRARAALGAAERRPAARDRGAQHLPVVARVHGVVRAPLRRQRRPAGRRLLRHDAGARPADQGGGAGAVACRRPASVAGAARTQWRRRRPRRAVEPVPRRGEVAAGQRARPRRVRGQRRADAAARPRRARRSSSRRGSCAFTASTSSTSPTARAPARA